MKRQASLAKYTSAHCSNRKSVRICYTNDDTHPHLENITQEASVECARTLHVPRCTAHVRVLCVPVEGSQVNTLFPWRQNSASAQYIKGLASLRRGQIDQQVLCVYTAHKCRHM